MPQPADGATAIAHREERTLAWFRIVGGALAIALLPLFAAPLPDGGRGLAALFAGAAIVTGVVALRLVVPSLDARRFQRIRLATLASDAVTVLLFTALYADQPALGLFVFALPVQGAMKFGAPGALAMTVFASGSGVLAQSARSALGGSFDGSLALASILPGLAFGLMVTFLATSRGHEAVEAMRLARGLEGHRAAGRVVHAVAASATDTNQAARTLLAAATTRTRVELAVLLDVRDGDATEIVAILSPGAARTTDVEIDAGGPTATAIAAGRTMYSPPGDAVARRGLRDGTAVVAIPILSDGRTAAVLIGESSCPTGISETCIAELQQTADQLALIVGLDDLRARRDVVEREIAELERARDQVLAIGSHELRTPLTTIVGFSELMATHGDAMSGAEIVQFGRAINRASVRLHRTLEDVQLADNLRRRVLPTQLSTVEIGPLTSGVAELWPGTLVRTGGRTRVVADPEHLRNVLERLLDNAWEHGGGIDVEVSWTILGDRAVVAVSDRGPGIDDAERARVRAAFAQGSDVLHHQRGTGLGLTIAHGLCDAMQADLVLGDSGDDGTRWEVWLPLVTTTPAAASVELTLDPPAVAPTWERRARPRRPAPAPTSDLN